MSLSHTDVHLSKSPQNKTFLSVVEIDNSQDSLHFPGTLPVGGLLATPPKAVSPDGDTSDRGLMALLSQDQGS